MNFGALFIVFFCTKGTDRIGKDRADQGMYTKGRGKDIADQGMYTKGRGKGYS